VVSSEEMIYLYNECVATCVDLSVLLWMPGKPNCQELPERSEATAVVFSPAQADDTDTPLVVLWDTGLWQIQTNS